MHLPGSPKKSNRFLLLLLALGLSFFSVAQYAHADVNISNGSVLSLYHFNSQSLTDSSGNGRNATDSSMCYTSTSTKLGAYAASTGDSTSYYYTASSTWDLSGDFTIGFWFNPQEALGSGSYIFWRNIPSGRQEGISYSAGCTANHLEFLVNS